MSHSEKPVVSPSGAQRGQPGLLCSRAACSSGHVAEISKERGASLSSERNGETDGDNHVRIKTTAATSNRGDSSNSTMTAAAAAIGTRTFGDKTNTTTIGSSDTLTETTTAPNSEAEESKATIAQGGFFHSGTTMNISAVATIKSYWSNSATAPSARNLKMTNIEDGEEMYYDAAEYEEYDDG